MIEPSHRTCPAGCPRLSQYRACATTASVTPVCRLCSPADRRWKRFPLGSRHRSRHACNFCTVAMRAA